MSHFKYILYLFAFAYIIINIVSCKENNSNVIERLTIAERIVEQNPDSALSILDSIIDLYSLNDRDYNKFLLLQIQAKDKAYKDISSDTIIFQIKDYYIKQNNIEKAALASFYCGRLLQENKKYKDAVTSFQETIEYCSKTKDYNLLGLAQSSIGRALLKQYLKDEAIFNLKKSADNFKLANNNRNEIIAYNNIGNAFLMKSESDSAFYYYNKGLDLAKETNDSLQMAYLTQCIGVAYREIGNYDKAMLYFKKSSQYFDSDDDKSRLNLNIGKTYLELGKIDSSSFYVDRALLLQEKVEDIRVFADIYKTLSKIDEKNKNYELSLDYHKKYSEYLTTIVNENKSKEIVELQKKYQIERYQNENSRLKLKENRIYLILLIIVAIAVLMILFFYRKSEINKKEVLKKENEILEAEKKIYQLMEMSKSYENKDNSIRDILLHHFDILKKVALLEKYTGGDKRQDYRLIKVFNEIVYGQESLDWNMFYETMDKVKDGFFSKLKEKYPSLDETEFRICCLTYSQFNCPQIGIILGLSSNTVQQKRSNIRKKIGLEAKGDIVSYLDFHLQNG